MNVIYHGIFDEIINLDIRFEPIKRGESVEVSDELGKRLLDQPDNWREAGAKAAPSRGRSDTAD